MITTLRPDPCPVEGQLFSRKEIDDRSHPSELWPVLPHIFGPVLALATGGVRAL
ncbi:MAG: hypothetical protein ABEH35_08730 [Haloarculaceae archaeon]